MKELDALFLVIPLILFFSSYLLYRFYRFFKNFWATLQKHIDAAIQRYFNERYNLLVTLSRHQSVELRNHVDAALRDHMAGLRAEIPGLVDSSLRGFYSNFQLMRDVEAVRKAVCLSEKYMPMAVAFEGTGESMFGFDRLASRQLLEFCVSKLSVPDGMVLEFGVHKGESIAFVANLMPDTTLHGFDSFVGLPEDWKVDSPAGKFDEGGVLPVVPQNVVLHAGWFSDTLPAFLAGNAAPASFINIDCDLHSSTKFVLESLSGRLVVGTIIHFDEYFKYVGWELHEYKAWQDFVKARGIQYQYIGYAAYAYSVAVKILALDTTPGIFTPAGFIPAPGGPVTF